MAEKKRERVVGTIMIGDDPFFEVVDKDAHNLDIRFVYEREGGLHLPKKLVRPLISILKAYQEQRRHQRLPLTEDILLESTDKTVSILARTRDLSESGASVDAPALLPKGSEINVLLPPKRSPIKARALVRNSRDRSMGLEFLEVAPASRPKLAKLLQKARKHVVS